MNEKIEVIHHEPNVYRLYDYLKQNHLGIENGIKKPELAQAFGVNERELRKLTKAINESTELEKLIRNTYRVAIALFKKAKMMEKKVGLNGQIKIKLGKHYKDVVEIFSAEE